MQNQNRELARYTDNIADLSCNWVNFCHNKWVEI